jgi:hypothetical protein
MSALRKYGRSLALATGMVLAGIGLTTYLGGVPGQAVAQGTKEHHPHIHRAIHELREARQELKTAAHDFGGHRVESIKAIDVAIHQLEKALKYDRK